MRALIFKFLLIVFVLGCRPNLNAQPYLLQADRVFDGEEFHLGWSILVDDGRIVAVGPASGIKTNTGTIVLRYPGSTLMPGMIEGHSHLLLHPYNETSWDDQVLKESDALRVARATVHARKTLEAGFTTVRDLGSEGAGYADVGLKKSIDQGIIEGPGMLVAGRAIVATGSYGPTGFDTDFEVMLGAEQADGDDLIRVVRDQIGKGADVVKVYADYRWGVHNEAQPTFSEEELRLIVETARSSGRPVVAHAVTPEAMRRAIVAGVETIEHGDGGTPEVFKLMKDKGVALCPTVAAGDAIARYRGWKKGADREPEGIIAKRKSFALALQSGVTIIAGGDVGVFSHGDNVRELELMNEYGMDLIQVLRSVTSVNAKAFHLDQERGAIRKGLSADIIAVEGDLSKDLTPLRKVKMVMKNGVVFRK